MALPPLESTVQNWNRRSAMAQQVGVPQSSVAALAQYDIQRVKAGSSPLTNQEVEDALNAQLFKSPIVQQERPHGLLNILGNVPGDVGDLIRGFIPGTVGFVRHLPSEVKQLGTDLSHPSLQSLSHDPILSLIPGVYDAGQLATSQGRQWMEQHPVSSLLDILPLASSAGKAAMAGRALEAGSAGEALARGSVLRAGLRAGTDTVSNRVSGLLGRNVDLRANFNKRMAHLGLDPMTRELIARPYAQLTRQARAEMRVMWDDKIEPLVASLTPEDRRDLFHDATIGGGVARNPAHQHILNAVREWNHGLFDRASERKALYGIVLPGGHRAVYNYKEPVARLHRKVTALKDSVETNEARLRKTLERAQQAEDIAAGHRSKVRRFMESDESFANRPPEAIDAPHLLQAIQPLSEAFTHLNPMEVFGEYLGSLTDEARRPALRQIIKDFQQMSGEFARGHLPDQPASSLFASLTEALQSEDFTRAKQITRRIRQIVGKKSWDAFNTTSSIRSFLTDFQDTLTGMKMRRDRSRGAERKSLSALQRVQRANEMLGTRRDQLTQLQGEFNKELAKSPDASFHPIIQAKIKSMVADRVREGNIQAHVQITADIFRQIEDSPNGKFLQDIVGKEEFKAIRDSALSMWLDMAKAGFDPIWIKKTTTDQLERSMFPKPITDRKAKVTQFVKRQVMDFSPGMHDIAAGVTAAESELIRESFTTEFLNHIATTFGKRQSAVYPEYQRYAEDANRVATLPSHEHARALMEKEWSRFEPEKYGISSRVFHHPTDLLIPKGVDRSLGIMQGGYRLFGKEHEGGFFGIHGAYDKALHVFRLSVLTGPRHFIHVAGGGMAFLALRQPLALRQLGRAWDLFNEGKVPNELMGAVTDFKADQIWNFKVGQQVASVWRDYASKAGNLHDKYVAFEQKVATVQRAAAYLEAAPNIGHEAALHEAYKTFVELDSMAPIERAVMKQMIPFYPFMRHLFRYLFTLPVDHPYRVGILSRFAQQEQDEWTTGLPEMYQSYLFMGQPDQNGNVVGIDLKNINPFRSFYNDFTLSGFVSAANPLFSGFGTAMGLNILTASPNLYSDWSYNPVTGGRTTNRPANIGVSMLESFVPETQAIDSIIGLSNRYKALRQSNPAAFQRELFNYLNIPFATSKVNVPLTEERAEITRLQAAQTAVSNAMKSGDWTDVNRFDVVPYNGQLVSAPALSQYMTSLQSLLAQYGIADPNSVMRKPTVKHPFQLA